MNFVSYQPNPADAPKPGSFSVPNSELRLSDTDRADAFSRLTFAYGEGRLDLAEYDRRCDAVTEAVTHSDLVPLFRDLPAEQTTKAAGPPAVQSREVGVYTRQEIQQARVSGQRTRLGIFGLGTLGTFAAMGALGQAGLAGWAGVTFLIIPTLFILLYVMKVGPDSWYTPSPWQLEKQRLRELQAARRIEEENRRALRAAQRDQITGSAIDLAQNALERFRK